MCNLFCEQRDQIQASVKQKLAQKFGNELFEGEYCDIMTFEVSNNNGDYKGTTHPYKINFMYTMCMKPSEHISDISRFNFSHFSEILTQSNVDETFIGWFYFNNILHVNMSRFNFSPFSKILTQSDVGEAFIGKFYLSNFLCQFTFIIESEMYINYIFCFFRC